MNEPSSTIHWLVQSATEESDLARGVAPLDLLHPAETTRFGALKTRKRRSDWLIGRWTAKRLLQTLIEREWQVSLPLNAIAVCADASGAPRLMADCGFGIADWAVSISHARQRGFCAASSAASIGLGADIEHIELRDWRFVEDYFTPGEIDRVRVAAPDQRETLITAIWGAKEAAVKALHCGLTIDTRRVECAIDPFVIAGSDWVEFTIECRRGYIQHLRGWWRVWEDFVLTLAVTTED